MNRHVASAALAATLVPAASAIDIVYIGPPGGLWTDPLNWTAGVVPGVADTAFVNGSGNGATSVIAPGLSTVDILDIEADDLLDVPGSAQFRIESALINRGELLLSASPSARFLRALGTPVTITGGGTISVTDGSTMDRLSVGGAWINEDNLLRGAGAVGANSTPFTNRGTVRADVPGATLQLDAPAGTDTFINESLYEAALGGRLQLRPGQYRNVGGVIEAGPASSVELAGILIRGGTFRATGDGLFEVTGTTTVDAAVEAVDVEGVLLVQNAAQLRATGELRIFDELILGSTDSATFLRADTGPLDFTGGGTITMQGSAVLDRVTSGGSLRTVDVTIHGVGQIGANSTGLTNESMVIADVDGGELRLDPPSSPPFVNAGVYRAEDGGIMRLAAGEYVNLGATIEAVDDGSIVIESIDLDGGTIRTASGGMVTFSGLPLLRGDAEPIVLDGDAFTLANAGQLRATGSLQVLDTLRIASTGSGTFLRAVNEPLTLEGGGTIRLEGDAVVDRVEAGGEMIVEDVLLAGEGLIGANAMRMTNRNVIRADVDGGTLRLDPPTGDDRFINDGRLEAVGTARLELRPGTFENETGVIEASENGEVFVQSATIRGGLVRSTDDAVVRLAGVTVLDGGLDPVHLEGAHEVQTASQIRVRGELRNDATLFIDGQTSGTFFNAIDEPMVITGTGEIIVTGTNTVFSRVAAGGSIVNESNVIRGSGRFGANSTNILNRGTIRADDPDNATIFDPPTGDGLENEGRIEIAATSASAQMLAGPFENRGLVWIEDGATLTRSGSFVQAAGESAIEGILVLSPGATLIASAGRVTGGGSIIGGLSLATSTVDPGNDGQIGTLNVAGPLDLSLSSTVHLDVAGDGAGEGDALAVEGALLGGRLELDFVDGFVPPVGSQFTIIQSAIGGIVGTFDDVACDAYVVQYFDDMVRVEVVAVIEPEDLDCSGTVDFADLLSLLGSWGPCVGCPADFDGDGVVAFGDLLQLLAAWD